ncbi:TPA: EAL domain-containing protein [Serratia marcescens]|uniref:Sensor domain-containing phosphodiesterase n=3 Tax=Serratia TaxID=613 RepID=A0AAW6X0K9_9GAMM|nr:MULTISPECIES: sensor domain-containing phosphodiesterase [Serratia]AUY14979.1 phosphodiesterase [Serratia sp. SSNIH1]EGT3594694.1 EAL domain-containing protein [Serratia marcescens]EHT9936491.1 EAL domain-containing protein [Serratia marcescens]EIJ6676352.1 EAL domain-containing protein [Serratia marcescens]EME9755035.1 EAL domain-containing protein [Serratia marcescens]
MLRHLSKNEDERLAAIDALAALGAGHDDAIHQVLNITRKLLEASGCLICLYGSRKIWLRAQIDIGFEEIDFASPLFNFVRLQGEALFCPDTFADERFASDPMVRGEAAVRHCTAIPLSTREGYTIGAFCLVGPRPKHLTRRQVELLRSMATIVAELIEAQSEIGLVDAITRLPNRQRLMGELGNLADTGKYALLLVDTIDIKYAYEMARSFGLSTVELLLGDIGHFLKETFLSDRMLYSIAPGRFAVIIAAQQIPQAKHDLLRCADRLHREVRGDVPLRLELYAGYALFSAPHADPAEILRQATSALHDSIDEGRIVSLYSEPKDAVRKHKFNLFNELAQSLKQNRGLFLEYQPQIDLTSGRIVGAEALLRWRHERLGAIPTAEFIPLVENTSLIKPLTEFVIAQSIEQLLLMREAGIVFPISINVTAGNLAERHFAARLHEAIVRRGLQPGDIEIECLESQRIQESSVALACLHTLKANGHRIALDDFGAGYSNLNYLRHIPADVVKLDASLIKQLKSDAESRIIVQNIIDMLHKLNYEVLAEGVEDQESLHYLTQYRCDVAQGFYFSPAVTLEKLCALVDIHGQQRRKP